MAKPLENSLERFAPARPVSIGRVAAPIAVALILAALVVAATLGNWLLIVILSLSLVVTLTLIFSASRAGRAGIAGLIEWEAVAPELQRQDLSISVAGLSKVLEPEFGSESELQSAFIVAQDLALRQIQQEEGVPVMRHVGVGGVPFDVAFTKGDVLVCGDVSFLVSPELNQERVLSAMRKIAAVKNAIAGMNVRLMMVLVTQMNDGDVAQLRNSLGTKRFSSTPVDIDIRLLDFETLQNIYVAEK